MDTAKDVNWCLVLKEYADANKYRDNGHPESYIPVNAYRDQSGDDNDLENDVENIVGELQELCQKNKWPLPSYTQRTVGHSYTCSCNVTAPGDEYEVVYVYAKVPDPRRESQDVTLRKEHCVSQNS
ncbi:hypothetical protein KUCAC02_025138 [Chaenocephalus aceratus]|nr:hypothetical protein KUCAC02_025138 [Chaenocephalus aceratus]